MSKNRRKIRMGMLGGGPASFIGPVHRIAANLDGLIELVCGCFSSDPSKSVLNFVCQRNVFIQTMKK